MDSMLSKPMGVPLLFHVRRNKRRLPSVLGFHHDIRQHILDGRGSINLLPAWSTRLFRPMEPILQLLFQMLQGTAGVQWIVVPVISRRGSHGNIGVRILIWTGLRCRHLGMAIWAHVKPSLMRTK